ncbi:MAG TPA: ABC transporter substrate-binding protein [Acidimicrobiales bacterium]|nr:ABC transporter substrate-binding protein [Acidimicrobiales bacterium]
MNPFSRPARIWTPPLALAVLSVGILSCGGGSSPTLRIGAVFPLTGAQAALGRQELEGVKLAAQLANRAGGVDGRPIELEVKNLTSQSQAGPTVAALKSTGASIVMGAYSSLLSIPVATAAAQAGLVYWETGAVADHLTGHASPLVFRVGASGANLGTNSANFAASVLAPRLGLAAERTRVSVVFENDAYGQSVAGAAVRTVGADGMQLVLDRAYDAYRPDWGQVMSAVVASRPDILILASYIPDGVAFRRAMLADHVQVGAMIGSTMAECGPDFGNELGPQAVGVFASDRPEGDFNPSALDPTGKRDFHALATAWKQATGQASPTEEALSGFSAAWALFHDVLPHAAASLTPSAVAAAARAVDLPLGELPNGAGLRFATGADLGQNLRAAAVIWQWQAPRHSVVVWPAVYATGGVRLVPLPAS